MCKTRLRVRGLKSSVPAGPEKVTAKEAARHETNQESRTVRQIGSVADVHRLPALRLIVRIFLARR